MGVDVLSAKTDDAWQCRTSSWTAGQVLAICAAVRSHAVVTEQLSLLSAQQLPAFVSVHLPRDSVRDE